MNSVEQEICLNLEQMNIEENESRHEESEVDLARLNTYHQVPSVFDSKVRFQNLELFLNFLNVRYLFFEFFL